VAVAVSEFVSFRFLESGAIVRAVFGAALVVVGVTAWKRDNVRIAIIFLSMLVFGMVAMVIVHQRWIRGF
jgi:hypothetical protein